MVYPESMDRLFYSLSLNPCSLSWINGPTVQSISPIKNSFSQSVTLNYKINFKTLKILHFEIHSKLSKPFEINIKCNKKLQKWSINFRFLKFSPKVQELQNEQIMVAFFALLRCPPSPSKLSIVFPLPIKVMTGNLCKSKRKRKRERKKKGLGYIANKRNCGLWV